MKFNPRVLVDLLKPLLIFVNYFSIVLLCSFVI